eukprot:4105166-Pyramimonas_sp.AAC.1
MRDSNIRLYWASPYNDRTLDRTLQRPFVYPDTAPHVSGAVSPRPAYPLALLPALFRRPDAAPIKPRGGRGCRGTARSFS